MKSTIAQKLHNYTSETIESNRKTSTSNLTTDKKESGPKPEQPTKSAVPVDLHLAKSHRAGRYAATRHNISTKHTPITIPKPNTSVDFGPLPRRQCDPPRLAEPPSKMTATAQRCDSEDIEEDELEYDMWDGQFDFVGPQVISRVHNGSRNGSDGIEDLFSGNPLTPHLSNGVNGSKRTPAHMWCDNLTDQVIWLFSFFFGVWICWEIGEILSIRFCDEIAVFFRVNVIFRVRTL